MNELIKAAQMGVSAHELPGLFTSSQFKDYIAAKKIEKSPGVPYSKNYLNCVLSDSSIRNSGAKNYDKVLDHVRLNRKQHYFFMKQADWELQGP